MEAFRDNSTSILSGVDIESLESADSSDLSTTPLSQIADRGFHASQVALDVALKPKQTSQSIKVSSNIKRTHYVSLRPSCFWSRQSALQESLDIRKEAADQVRRSRK